MIVSKLNQASQLLQVNAQEASLISALKSATDGLSMTAAAKILGMSYERAMYRVGVLEDAGLIRRRERKLGTTRGRATRLIYWSGKPARILENSEQYSIVIEEKRK